MYAARNLVSFALAIIVTSPVEAENQRTAGVLRALSAHLKIRDALSPNTQYGIAFADLNSDGRPEAVIRLVDEDWCGSGGCHMFVFTPADHRRWSWVGTMTLTQLPIYRLPSRHHGWNDLGVTVRSDYVRGGFVAVPFNGIGYALNPTVPPSKRTRRRGKLLIPSDYDPLHTIR